jgi:hypothetical protein
MPIEKIEKLILAYLQVATGTFVRKPSAIFVIFVTTYLIVYSSETGFLG